MGPFRYLLFAAVAVSLSVYLYRGYRRWVAPPQDPIGAIEPTAGPAATPPAPAPVKPKRSLGFTNPTIEPEDRSDGESLVQAVIREELARKRAEEAGEPVTPGPDAPAPAAGRSGLFAGGDGRPGSTRVSVAAALTGVRLPDSLVPLVATGAQADPHRVTFVATSVPAADVGRALGDELERLGYRVASESDVVAVATKGEAKLRIALFPDAANERLDGARRFPTVAGGSVVVEFST